MIAFDDLKLAEVMAIEEAFGCALDDLTSTRAAGAVLWIVARRDVPELTFDEFAESLTMGALRDFVEAEEADAANPTVPPPHVTAV